MRRFPLPTKDDLGDISTARLLYDSARLAFRNGAGPFRALAKLSFRPRSYQMVPLIMALRQESVRLLIADDVGVGKTVEALLIVRELLERRKIKRFAVVCLPHLCEQWQAEIRDKLDLEAVIIRSNTQARLDRQIQGDTSVYDYYPYQVISIDFIKSDTRRDVFIEQCPELVIVDEAHTCARPAGASASQQQRYHLVSRIAQKPGQQTHPAHRDAAQRQAGGVSFAARPPQAGVRDARSAELHASAAPRTRPVLRAAQTCRRRKMDGGGDAVSQA